MTHVADEKNINKFFRFLHGVSERALKGSLDVEQFTAVTQVLLDKGARAKNLLEYVAKGCPKVNYSEPVSKKKDRAYNGSTFFQNRKGLWVSDDIDFFIGLDGHTTRDTLPVGRILKSKTTAADVFGHPGTDEYAATLRNAVDLGQIEAMIKVDLLGKSGVLLKNGYANIFGVRGENGLLFTVFVTWRHNDHTWDVYCELLEAADVWRAGDQVFSN